MDSFSLLWHETAHIVFSLVISACIYLFYYRSAKVFLAGLLAGVMIDLDHLVGYAAAFGRHFDIRQFLAGHQFLKNPKMYVLLHSWELVIVLLAVALWKKRSKPISAVTLCVSLCMAGHLLVDHFSYSLAFRSYFLSYRVCHRFETARLVTDEQWAENRRRAEMLGY